MSTRSALMLLFGAILAAMLAVTGWAALGQNLWQWGGLVRAPDRGWTIATLCDAYAGFITFYAWVYYKETRLGRCLWLVAILALGNIAMATFMLRELARLKPHEPLERLLTHRRVGP